MIRAWRAWFNWVAASLERWAAEQRAGISIVRAVEIDKRWTDLLAVTGSAELAAEMQELAVELGKLGATPEIAHEAFRQFYVQPNRTHYELIQLERYIKERIENL